MEETLKLRHLPNGAEVTFDAAEEAVARNLLTSATQGDGQKKKRQRRATPPGANSVASKVESNNASLADATHSLNGMSGLPHDTTSLPIPDHSADVEIAIGKMYKYRTPYVVDMEVADNHLTKAASRMRKYRLDHKHDQVWLAKEADRMRSMRATWKADGFKVKPKKEKVLRRRKDKGVCLSELAPLDRANHEEYLKKEAERVRKYRAVKQLDPEWKKNDSDRMRLYRAKRKLDALPGNFSSAEVPIDDLMPLPLSLKTPSSSSAPSQTSSAPFQILLLSCAEQAKGADTDSENEAQV